ncbi:hypothetical protein MtrunA17_Chr8g0381641 [Medicago truncatula]|uniref:Uncharacterized protein n=1 Tax=Medicago truncatula TaxID=3880 RepID=A0A072U4M2_MEDTR|nr:hypothetical protein MTR_8g089830 [Medicago truncatula]RHN42872.1 hypothetical protein MtrunA17_Chr8g0381641 [Medicago truncatula]
MAYQNRNHNNYGWSHMHEIYEPAYYPGHHHQKRRVTVYEEPMVEADQSYYLEVRRETEIETDRRGLRYGDQNVSTTYESVDEEADAFIQHEHRRTALAKLMSSMRGT